MVFGGPDSVAALARPWSEVQLVPPAAYAAARAVDPARPPQLLLNEARACEPAQLMGRRAAALDELAALGPTPSLRRQAEAERAIDDARTNLLDAAEARALAVLAALPEPTEPTEATEPTEPTEPTEATEATEPADLIARARALEALGRVQVWRGDRASAAAGAVTLAAAVELYEKLGCTEWAGDALFWIGNAVHHQRGKPAAAEALIRDALALLAPASPRRAGILTFLADVYETTGRWSEHDACLEEAAGLVVDGDLRAKAYLAWSRARRASTQRDTVATIRHLADVERSVGDWFETTTGATFLGDAAVLAARVGDDDAAAAYLARALERDPDDEFVRMAQAELLARSGDPEEALLALRRIGRAAWSEVRQRWRLSLLEAWASLRAGHGEVGELAARALAQADAAGGPAVALTGEPELARLLAPAAARAGSPHAAALLTPAGGLQLRLLGESTLVRDAVPEPLPPGVLGTLLRVLAVQPAGLDAEELCDVLWPDSSPEVGRRQLRHALSRLRARASGIVVRDGSRLLLGAVWVDTRAFREAADRALAERSEGAVLAALLLWTGTPLPADPYAEWAVEVREQLQRRRLQLLDLAADAAAARGARSHAATLLESAIEADPLDTSRYARLARLLEAEGRLEAAERWARAGHRPDELA